MNRTSVRYVLVIALAMLALSACDKSSANSSGETDNNHTNNHNHNNINNNPNTNNGKADLGDDPGAGPDDDATYFEPGEAQGSWRVASEDGFDGFLLLTLFQDKGDPTLTGNYSTLPAFFEEDSVGEIAEGTYSDGTLVVKFNPTADQDEMYTITATMQADKTFKGTLTAKGGGDPLAVSIAPPPAD